jgi:hypothetical protein
VVKDYFCEIFPARRLGEGQPGCAGIEPSIKNPQVAENQHTPTVG